MDRFTRLSAAIGLSVAVALALDLGVSGLVALALPPIAETPEEILRTEIITAARSPIDGRPLSAAEYATLMEQLQDPNYPIQAKSNLNQLVLLLRLRRVVQPVLPFLFE